MNIVIVIDLIDTLTNGSVMTARRFADGLRERGHCVKIVAVGADGKDDCAVEERHVPVISVISAKSQIKYGKFDREKIKKAFSGADVVHFIFPFKFEKKCKRLADEMGIPATAAFHVQPENVSYNAHLGRNRLLCSFIYAYFRRAFYSRFRRIHCPSDFIANQLVRHGYGGRLYVISNGCDRAFKSPEEKKKNEKFEIVMVGRLAPEKNQRVIISAIARSSHKDDVHLTLLGNGICKRKLARRAKALGVDITFGFMPKEKLVPKLQQSDLYVHSATVEIEAIACIEAISCGLVPVISDSKLSATPQFALDKRSLFKDNDAKSLAAKIDYWYEHEDERIRMGRVYAEFAQRFSLDKSLEQTEFMFADEINEARLCESAALLQNKL